MNYILSTMTFPHHIATDFLLYADLFSKFFIGLAHSQSPGLVFYILMRNNLMSTCETTYELISVSKQHLLTSAKQQ